MRGEDLLLFHLAALDEPGEERSPHEPAWDRVEAALGADLTARVRLITEGARPNGAARSNGHELGTPPARP